MASNQAFVTLSTNDTYSLGALVLANSLRNVETTRKLVILVTPGVSASMRDILATAFDEVRQVNVIDSKDEAILQIMKRPELGVTLSKLHCWRLVEYSKCVFMDADTLVLKNIDDLFEREELSAACDIGWPDCFNTGVFVFKPSEQTYSELVKLLAEKGSFDGGDQGLLNQYFSDWATKDISKHLSFIYNMSSVSVYSYAPAYKQFGDRVKVVHFLGSFKPWMYGYNAATGEIRSPIPHSNEQFEHVRTWWKIFVDKVQPQLSAKGGAQIAAELSQLKLSEEQTGFIGEADSAEASRKQNWETGNVDYLGVDRFDNIQRKLDEAIGGDNLK